MIISEEYKTYFTDKFLRENTLWISFEELNKDALEIYAEIELDELISEKSDFENFHEMLEEASSIYLEEEADKMFKGLDVNINF